MANDIRIFSVSELTRKVKQLLEGSFATVAVQGELSNFKRHSSGHIYFTLKDESAQIAGVMWRSRAESLAFTPQDGMKVLVHGRLTVYEVRGVYQIDAWSIQPLGVGELQIAFEKLKKKLAEEGLFVQERKRPLPEFPERIGIVTSPTGAALQDMLNIFRRRFPALTVVLYPARVQGPGAAEEIAHALQELNAYGELDLIIVGRGGGSLEDLWAFNEEIVARAIAASAIPVVSAVGHEIDFTIADFVADLRAPTPSAAAELVVKERKALLEILREYCYTMHDNIASVLESHRDNIYHLLKSYAFNRPLDLLRQYSQRIDELRKSVSVATLHGFDRTSDRHDALRLRLESLDPRRVLRRGYAIVSKEGRFVVSRTAVRHKDELEITFHDGNVKTIAE